MPRNLEPPNYDADDWDILYLARGGGEVADHRPFLTGDVFAGVTVQAPRSEPKTKDVMILQHPCAMRPNGVDMADSILVAEVHKFPVLPLFTGTVPVTAQCHRRMPGSLVSVPPPDQKNLPAQLRTVRLGCSPRCRGEGKLTATAAGHKRAATACKTARIVLQQPADER